MRLKYSLLKIISLLLIFLFFFLAPLPGKKALAWETWGSIPMGVGMDKMIEQLMIVMTGAAKQAAIKMITEKVYSAVSGGSGGGGPKFIVNWQGALETDPQKEAAIFIESMSSMSTQMRGSANYQSSEGVGGGNYMSGLSNIVSGITSQASSSNKCPVTYTGDPSNMFADGTFKNFSQYMSGNNDPWSYQTCMQKAYEDKLASLKEIAKTKATAYQGFIGTGQDGNVSYPGILVKEKMANVENMGNEVIANAKGLPEVITATVMKMGMDAMNNGIGNVQAQIQKNVTNVSDKINTQIQNQTKNFGPGALYGNSSTTAPQ